MPNQVVVHGLKIALEMERCDCTPPIQKCCHACLSAATGKGGLCVNEYFGAGNQGLVN